MVMVWLQAGQGEVRGAYDPLSPQHPKSPDLHPCPPANDPPGAPPPPSPRVTRHQPGAPPAKGCGLGAWPMWETPPCVLKNTGQLWGVGHRTKPWVPGHTTANPQNAPGNHVHGGPSLHVTHDKLSECSETNHGRGVSEKSDSVGGFAKPPLFLKMVCGGLKGVFRRRDTISAKFFLGGILLGCTSKV